MVYFFLKKLLSQIIKLVNGGLKNLIKKTESTVKNINDTIISVLIWEILCANRINIRTK